jgi:hypothetical protein
MEKSRKTALVVGSTQYFTGKECISGHIAARRTKSGECLECRKIALKEWRNKNPHRVKQHNDTQYLKYPQQKELWAARAKRYASANKDKTNQKTKAYQAAKINRVPKWVDSEEMWLIQEAYDLAVKRTKLFGFSWHVDHIVPLRGKIVSGLHTIGNLQVIPGIENVKKANRFQV